MSTAKYLRACGLGLALIPAAAAAQVPAAPVLELRPEELGPFAYAVDVRETIPLPVDSPTVVGAPPADSVPAAAPAAEEAPALVQVGLGTVKFGGLIQAWYSAESRGEGNTFRLRRAELKFTGEIDPRVRWTLMVDPAKALKVSSSYVQVGDTRVVSDEKVSQGSLLLQDAHVTLRFGGVELDAGQFKLPLSLEGGPQPSAKLETVERALFMQAGKFGGVRDLGMMLSGPLTGGVDFQLGVFNGVGESQNNVDADARKVVAGRAQAETPIAGLRLGASGAWSGPRGDDAPRADRLGVDALFTRGPLQLKGEVMSGRDGDTERMGWYAHAGYRVGALEGVARYDVWDADTSAEAAEATLTQRDHLAGLNYYLNGSTVKLQANLLHRTFGGGLPSRQMLLFNVQTGW